MITEQKSEFDPEVVEDISKGMFEEKNVLCARKIQKVKCPKCFPSKAAILAYVHDKDWRFELINEEIVLCLPRGKKIVSTNGQMVTTPKNSLIFWPQETSSFEYVVTEQWTEGTSLLPYYLKETGENSFQEITTFNEKLFRLGPNLEKNPHDIQKLENLLRENYPLLAKKGALIKEEEFKPLGRCIPGTDYPCNKEVEAQISFIPSPKEKDVFYKYVSENDIYILTQSSKKGYIDETKPINLMKDGKVIFSGVVCQGTFDYPLIYMRLIEGKLTFDYLDGLCFDEQSNKYARMNIFYEGRNINKEFGFERSRYLFSYKGKPGFIIGEENQEYLYFNGKKISSGFDVIRSYNHEDPSPPLLKIYDNGALLFGARKGKDNYIGEIDLNNFL
ncbi:MAG: hypothetical protein KKH97_02380 [Proteobacteria bacterium]|nr:hypothetical protein [Pseudomonadota bacterium]